MRNETANNLKKLRETINDCIKCSSEYLQLFQDGGSASKLYRTKIDLESIEKITRKFVNCSGNIVKEEIPSQEEYTIELPMGAQLVENLQKLEKVISNFIQYVDDYNKLERGEQYPALFQYPGEDNFIILGKIVQESFLGMTSENLHNGQEIESEDNKEIDNRFPQTNINDMLRFSTEQNTETLDSETTMNERNLILELRTVFQANPELFKKFQVEFLKFFRAKQDNLSQDTLNSLTTSNSLLSYLQSDSWCTSWSYSSSISDSLGHREVLYGNQNQPEEFAQHSLKDVHSILSRQARMLNDTDSLSSFINPSSVHGQESLQTSLESNSISMRHPQFIRSYDVDNKNFYSINVLLITRNDSLSINDNAKTEGCDDWVYRPASSLEQETIRLNERNQYRSGENIELSNDNSSTEQDEIRNKEEWRQTQQKVDDLESKSGEVTKLNGTIENLKKMNAGLEGKINNLTSQVGRLSEEKGALNIQFAEKEKLLNGKIGELEHQLRKQKEELDSTKQSLVSEVRSSELERIKAELERNINSLNDQIAQFNNERSILSSQLIGQKKIINDIQAQLGQESTKLQGFESKNKELNGKNEKFLGASTHSKRQGNYASVSFVLSGAFAVGASLIMSHLAICISLAVAALTFLTVGCYCSYKANTALSNVEIDNCVNPAVVEV